MLNGDEIFSFDLNESLYFEEGQEVSEILGISLEPEISIQSFRDYVSIRGVIELQGEYVKKVAKDDQVEASLDIHENHSWRYLEKIEERDNDQAVFSHRFPVEISVPAYRVTDMDDISVSIETFDYEIPADNQLIVSSTIEIFGISDHQPAQEEMNEQPREIGDFTESEARSFEFELKKQTTDEELDVAPVEQVDDKKASEEITEEVEDTTNRLIDDQTYSIEDFLKTKEKEEEIVVDEVVETSTDVVVESDSDSIPEPASEPERQSDADVDTDEEVRDTTYLKDLFEEEESEETYAQMRIYIVQEEDTLETISARYEIPTLQLLKQNRLEDDHLSEGQLLSISLNDKDQA